MGVDVSKMGVDVSKMGVDVSKMGVGMMIGVSDWYDRAILRTLNTTTNRYYGTIPKSTSMGEVKMIGTTARKLLSGLRTTCMSRKNNT